MKIKINDIFKNVSINKEKIILERRRNLSNINDSKNYVREEVKQNEPLSRRRKVLIEQDNLIDKIKKITNRFVVKKSYNFLFIFMVILAVVSIYTNVRTSEDINKESYEVFDSRDEKQETKESSISENLQDINSNNNDTRLATNIQTNNKSANTATKNISVETTPKVEPLSFVKPLNGEIIKAYSVNELLYSKTLESWKTHDAVDIKGNIGDDIKSVEKGLVEKIYEDSFLGTTVIIDHGQGYKSIYSNLDATVKIKEKQIVKKSAVIGKIGKTAIGEIKDDSHLHFMLMLNNKVIDPTSKIKF